MFPRTSPPTPETRGAPLHTADTSQHHYAQRQALLRSVLSRPLHHAASVSSFTLLVLRQAPQLLTGPSLQPSLTLTTAPCALGQNRHFLVPHTGLSLGPPPRSCGHPLSELCQKGPSVRPDPGHRHRPGGDPQPPSAGSPTRALARARGPTSALVATALPAGRQPFVPQDPQCFPFHTKLYRLGLFSYSPFKYLSGRPHHLCLLRGVRRPCLAVIFRRRL